MNKKIGKRPKKILFVSLELLAGGAQRQMINIANGLCRRGYGISFFLLSNEGVLRDSLDGDIKIMFPSPVSFIGRFRFLSVAYKLVRLFMAVVAEKPDILYSRHWTRMPLAVIGRILGIKTVSVEVNNLEQTLLLKKSRPFIEMRKLCAKWSDKVVANSRGLALEAKKILGLDRDVEVIYNGVDIEDVRKKSQEKKTHGWLGAETPVVVAMGRIRVQKGFSYLLEALEIANRTRTVRLIIIGEGEREKLEKLCENLAITDRTDFIHPVENPFPYISGADIFASSSLYEGLSNVVLEAMVLGKPVISTDHKHGANEIIESGINGILVPPKDPQSMAEAILKVLADGDLRSRLGEEARKRSKDFSMDKMISEYERLFSEI